MFTWKILEIFGNDEKIEKVKYYLSLKKDDLLVETEGYHQFSDGIIVKPFKEIKEEDLARWVEQDTTKDNLNPIKLNLEKQLNELKIDKKVQFPWEIDTFTIE